MRVSELIAYHVRIPLRKTIRHASFTRNSTDSLVVCCRLTDGTEGWGEGVPRPYVTGETIETAIGQLQATDLERQLGGTYEDLRAVIGRSSRFRPAGQPCRTVPGSNGRDCFGNTVRCAVELSLLDAACRLEGVPLSRITELVPEATSIRRERPYVRYSTTITAMSPRRQVLRAWQFRLYGFRQVKVKVGVEGADDTASLRRIRRIMGAHLDLRVDANEAWNCRNLESRLAPLLPYGITSVEQPVRHEEVGGLAAIRRRLSVPIMLDESLCSLSDARRAIELGTCDLFNIRLSKCGGFANSLKLAAMARQAGLGYQLGCQVGETGILSSAGRHFATSVDNIRFLEGSYDRHLVREPLTVEDLTFGWGGRAAARTGPGLGVTIDQAALKRVTVREEHWMFGNPVRSRQANDLSQSGI